jgi:glycosyltransferase involved in cell wall biosynthesis
MDAPGGAEADQVAQWQPDVCYLQGLLDLDAQAAFVKRFPTVCYTHNYGGLCASGTKQHGFPTARPCFRPFGPACLALYFPRRCGGLSLLTALADYRTNRRRRTLLLRARAVVANSRHMADELIRNGIPASRVHLLPLPLTATPTLAPPTPRPWTNRVLFVGRITALKGWSHLAAALPAATRQLRRPLTLVVAGDGPDRKAFTDAITRRGIPAEFLGWVGVDRREREMRAADLLVFPSIWPEPFGLVGIEAGCVGLPAVGYAVGGVPDWLIPGISGELAPGGRPNAREFAAAIIRALEEEGRWQQLRIGAWENARRFTAEAHLDALLPILEAAART